MVRTTFKSTGGRGFRALRPEVRRLDARCGVEGVRSGLIMGRRDATSAEPERDVDNLDLDRMLSAGPTRELTNGL